jgi:hypothetical protein
MTKLSSSKFLCPENFPGCFFVFNFWLEGIYGSIVYLSLNFLASGFGLLYTSLSTYPKTLWIVLLNHPNFVNLVSVLK